MVSGIINIANIYKTVNILQYSFNGVRTLVRPDISSKQQKVKLMFTRNKVLQLFSNFFLKVQVNSNIGNLIANQYHKSFTQL